MVADQSSLQFKKHYSGLHPFKESANIVKTQLKDPSVKLHASFFVSNQFLRAARLSRSSDKRTKASAHWSKMGFV